MLLSPLATNATTMVTDILCYRVSTRNYIIEAQWALLVYVSIHCTFVGCCQTKVLQKRCTEAADPHVDDRATER